MTKKTYNTSVEAINGLQQQGYTHNLAIHTEKECLLSRGTGIELSPGEFTVDAIHRFDGMTNPSDETIVYAISSNDNKVKGVVVNGYGVYAANASSTIVQHLLKHN